MRLKLDGRDQEYGKTKGLFNFNGLRLSHAIAAIESYRLAAPHESAEDGRGTVSRTLARRDAQHGMAALRSFGIAPKALDGQPGDVSHLSELEYEDWQADNGLGIAGWNHAWTVAAAHALREWCWAHGLPPEEYHRHANGHGDSRGVRPHELAGPRTDGLLGSGGLSGADTIGR